MKVTLLTGGGSGNVFPMLALARGLKASGYDVTLAAPPRYSRISQLNGIEFFSIRFQYQEILESEEGLSLFSGNPFKDHTQWKAMIAPMIRHSLDDSWEACREARMLIYHSSAIASPHIVERLNIPGFQVTGSPFALPTRSFPLPGVWNPDRDAGGALNRWSYAIPSFKKKFFKLHINEWRKERLSLPPLARGISSEGQPCNILHHFSTVMVPRPPDWPENAIITGYWTSTGEYGWRPGRELQTFLENGNPPVYIGFGRLSGKELSATLFLAAQAISRSGQRGIISVEEIADIDRWQSRMPQNVIVAGFIPHPWIFPRTSILVHHGGASTTATGIRAARPTIVCAKEGEGFFWGKMLHLHGASPRPEMLSNIDGNHLGHMIREVSLNPDYRIAATNLRDQLALEDGVATAIAHISRKAAEFYHSGVL